eukprot:SAG11_NODE_6093_length_1389_cov_30.029457_3_plen_37_part_01
MIADGKSFSLLNLVQVPIGTVLRVNSPVRLYILPLLL